MRRTSKPLANFLWDKTAYVLGAKRDPVTRKACPAHREHHAFRELHETLLSDADDGGLQALLRFLNAWEPQRYGDLPHAEAMLGSNVIFRLDGDRDWLHERPAARSVWAGHLARARPPEGVCLVTGAEAPIAMVHPVVKGVRGTHAAGAALVTFNLDTFASYGKTQGANAPISIQAAFAYSSALNALLAFDSRRRIRIGEMTVVFWAEAAADERTAPDVEHLLSAAMTEPPADAQAASAVALTLESIARGEPLTAATPQLPAGTRLHILGLAANVGRLSVRLWHVDTLGGLARRIVEHWDDLRIEPAPWPEPPPARRLLYETARQRKAERIPPTLGPALLRAILGGGRYVSAPLATDQHKGTGFSESDLELLWAALEQMFDHDRSATRGEMTARRLVVFRHASALGNAPAHRAIRAGERAARLRRGERRSAQSKRPRAAGGEGFRRLRGGRRHR